MYNVYSDQNLITEKWFHFIHVYIICDLSRTLCNVHACYSPTTKYQIHARIRATHNDDIIYTDI